jgi:hypothetical protein
MALGIFLVLVLVVTWFAVRSSYFVWKLIAASLWILLETYWTTVHPFSTDIPTGGSVDRIFVAVCWVAAFALFFMPFWYEKNENGNQVARGFKVTMNKLIGSDDNDNRRKSTRQERNAAYAARIESAKRKYLP